jgi:catechol 2,3-dioxygenase-like lactoylglutathione lyase family enzyme
MTDQHWPADLRTVTLSVPDPASAIAYYAELLDAEPIADGVVFADATCITLEEGRPGFSRAGFDVTNGAPTRSITDGEGRILELSQVEQLDLSPPPRGPTLGHLTFNSRAPVEVQPFYEALGFRLSEALDDEFLWLRCNPAHHTLAFSKAPAPGLHHVALDVPDAAALVRACDRLAAHGHRLEFGPGRHMVGNNMFVYFRDRYGIRFELLCELRRIERLDEPPLVHRDVPRERSVNIWGTLPPTSFRESL